MPNTIDIQMSQRGVIVLPKKLRQTNNLNPGDNFTILDLGGVFVLSPRRSEIDALADRITKELSNKGETLESMLQTLREERHRHEP